ncbi:uncharacterized protein LOC142501290 isoform X4 [Ascaphus truei]|uniref:uncharacterized protein LOC142501290 isoform X4 n=1 Tax=Ascaphus truei TaxID=8439 RepID=UPI003F5A42C6
MDERDSEECTNCGQRKAGGVIFHLLYCYDVYIMSAPSPQNPKQRKIDEYITQNILNPLEQHEYLCYHGCRNVCGGDVIISAMSKPTTIIPTTIVPVFRDKGFSSLQNFVLRPDYLDRTVFLFFDSTKIYPHAVSKNCFSICVDDPHLLRKLMETIDVNRKKNPLELRKRKLETQNDPESTMSSASEVQSYNPFRRSDRSRISFRGRPKAFTQFKDEVLLEDIKNLASPNGLLNHCHDPDEKKRHFAAKLLIKVIQKDMMIFCRNPDLQTFETTTGFLLQKEYTYNSEMYSNFEKLYCWILAAIFIRIYKFNDVSLKDHVKSLALKKYKASQNQFDQFCQKTYHKLAVSMHSKIKKNWPSLDGNESHIKKLEHYLSFVDGKMSTTDGDASEIDNMIGYFIRLPWDIRHIFLVIITEKIIEKKCMASAVSFFKEISTSVGKKHWEIFLDVVERATEHIQENYTKGDGKEPIAAYFSAPASLKNNMFTVFTDIWMLAATFYSILLYGRQPFEELAHLSVLEFVKEITTYHKAENPNSLPTDLWKIIELNLNSENTNRTSAENILQELDTYKDNLGDKKDTLYTVESICHPQNPGDIQRGYLDLNGNFKQDVINEPPESMYIDDFRQKGGQLHEIVSVRMSLNIRRKIKALFHENVLGTETILNGSYTTTLVSYPFSTYSTTLDKINTNVDLYRFLSYLEQITSALHYLHSQNILHCDLRCCYIYVNHHQDKLKVAHFGRAVSLEGKQTHLYKMMPSDAVKWSAPEVRSSGRYSKPSDIFNLAVVFLEAICTQDNIISSNHPLKSFTKFCYTMEKHATNITDRWGGRLNKLMQECWNQNPTKRPSLDAIKDTLEQLKAYDEFCSSDSSEVEIEMEEEQQEATPGSAVEGSQASGMGNDYENYDTLPTRPLPGIPSLLPRQSFLLPYSTTQPREDVPEDHPYDLVYEQRDASTMDLKDHWQRNVVYPLLSQERVINNTTRCISIEETSDYEDVGIH